MATEVLNAAHPAQGRTLAYDQPGERREPRAGGCPLHRLFGTEPAGDGDPATGAPLGVAARAGVFAFGLLAYAMFFGTILYAIGFVSGLIVPKHIDSGPIGGSILATIGINTALLSLFVVQHTIMARPAFKRWWTRIIPAAMERSIFVAVASACLMLLFWQWRPMPGVIWDVSASPAAYWILQSVALGGWAIVFLASFMVSHWDLFGVRQSWFAARNQSYRPIAFRLVGLYRLVRHPLMVGFLIAFWVTPVMSTGHMFFAAMTSLYILFGTWLEERDLVEQFGDTYRQYQKQVRAFIPLPRR